MWSGASLILAVSAAFQAECAAELAPIREDARTPLWLAVAYLFGAFCCLVAGWVSP